MAKSVLPKPNSYNSNNVLEIAPRNRRIRTTNNRAETDMEICEYLEPELSTEQARAIVDLTFGIWPDANSSVEQRLTKLLNEADSAPIATAFVVWHEDRAIAHAKTFLRQIRSGDQKIEILALAGVCTAPDFRGHGLGERIVRRAFSQIGNLNPNVNVSLFQTGVAPFYEKLGGRIVSNEFQNSLNGENPTANPWWDTHVMIHPAEFDWPDGPIDLNGPGY